MVLKVGSDPKIDDRLNAEPGQVIGREDDFPLGEQGFLLAMAMY
jgi:hypothetical protein